MTDTATTAPLTPAQERMWFLDQLDPADVSYHMYVTQRLRGRLDVAALAGALDRIVARHETLRTRFPSSEGRPYQDTEYAFAGSIRVSAVMQRQYERNGRRRRIVGRNGYCITDCRFTRALQSLVVYPRRKLGYPQSLSERRIRPPPRNSERHGRDNQKSEEL